MNLRAMAEITGVVLYLVFLVAAPIVLCATLTYYFGVIGFAISLGVVLVVHVLVDLYGQSKVNYDIDTDILSDKEKDEE